VSYGLFASSRSSYVFDQQYWNLSCGQGKDYFQQMKKTYRTINLLLQHVAYLEERMHEVTCVPHLDTLHDSLNRFHRLLDSLLQLITNHPKDVTPMQLPPLTFDWDFTFAGETRIGFLWLAVDVTRCGNIRGDPMPERVRLQKAHDEIKFAIDREIRHITCRFHLDLMERLADSLIQTTLLEVGPIIDAHYIRIPLKLGRLNEPATWLTRREIEERGVNHGMYQGQHFMSQYYP